MPCQPVSGCSCRFSRLIRMLQRPDCTAVSECPIQPGAETLSFRCCGRLGKDAHVLVHQSDDRMSILAQPKNRAANQDFGSMIIVQPAYGATLAGYLGQPRAPTAIGLSTNQHPLAVTWVSTDGTAVQESQPIPAEDAFHVVLQRRDMPPHEVWLNGHRVMADPYPRHSVSVIDLRCTTRTRIASPHEALVFYLNRQSLREIAEEYGGNATGEIGLRPGLARVDPVMARIGDHLVRVMRARVTVEGLLADQMLLLVQAHVATAYGVGRQLLVPHKGGLAPWQDRRVKEMLAASLAEPPSLATVAREVTLSPAHLARAFRQSNGMSPHRWLMQRRMEFAKVLLRKGEGSVAKVAEAVGFAEQGSFSKAFRANTGMAPSLWQRMHP